MKIHGIMLAKNESDIIEYSLAQSRSWCDYVYVFDNGSEDETWEIVKDLANSDDRIRPYTQRECPFRDSLRAEVYNAFRSRANAGDWWCRFDADEVYITNPKDFLNHVPRRHHVVWSLHHQFYLVANEAAKFPLYHDHQAPPKISECNLPQFFRVNASEPRFFRHRKRLQWNPNAAWPTHMGIVHPQRIRLCHYQYRSPAQIMKRLATRRTASEQGYTHFSHSLEAHWTSKLGNPETLLNCNDTPTDLTPPDPCTPMHLESLPTRAGKIIMHGLRFWP